MNASNKVWKIISILILLSLISTPILGISGNDLNSIEDTRLNGFDINELPIHVLAQDNDNSLENATEINDATFFNRTIKDSLSGFSGDADDFVDIYKIYLDNHAYEAGLNADKLYLWLNTSADFNLSLLLADPDLHILATTETGAGFSNGSIRIFAQSTGYHYLMVWLDPMEGDADYNLTYKMLPETNYLLDNNNDFSNGTGLTLSTYDMGRWIKKEFLNSFTLDQYMDVHDFYNITADSTENITIDLKPAIGNVYRVEIFNNTNISQMLADARFIGGVNNTPIYLNFNYSGNYSIRVFTFYQDPGLYGGSGVYSLHIILKPQNHPPEIRPGVNTTIYLYEDQPPMLIDLNNTIFYDPDINNTNDSLRFYFINENNDLITNFITQNIIAEIVDNVTLSITPKPDVNTSGDNISIIAFDWQDWNITLNITVVVLPMNDAPRLLSINDLIISDSDYLDLVNNATYTGGAFEDQLFNLTVVAYDIDDNELTFKYSSTTTFKTAVGFSDPYIFNLSFTPAQEQVGIIQVNISINETNNKTIPGDWVVVNITVNNTNDSPEMTAVNGNEIINGETISFIGNKGVFAGNAINFTITALDPDLPFGDSLVFNTTNITFLQRNILFISQTGPNTTNVSFRPTSLDVGIKIVNITVTDQLGTVGYLLLMIEVLEAEKKYSMTAEDCAREYNDNEPKDDYTYYELVYRRQNSQISYQMMAYTSKGDVPEADIVTLSSKKVGDYMLVTVKLRGKVSENTTIRVYFVRPFEHYEIQTDKDSKIIPEPYTPLASKYILYFSYNDPLSANIGNPLLNGTTAVDFTIHLGTLENNYGIKHNVEFGLFAQAYLKATTDYNYYTYDSIGVGSVSAPSETVSYLLTTEECLQEEQDTGDDDVYGYRIKFKDQDRSAGLTIEKTERGGHPEIDILRLSSRRVGFYFEVTISLADKISNDTIVGYSVYIVTFNHTENGVHLTPNEVTELNYPKQYAPAKGYYYQLGKYNGGNTIMADSVSIYKNRLTFSFHLGLLQHPELGNLSHNSNFGIFATSIREINLTSILDYGYYYDAAGLGAQKAPNTIIQERESDNGEEQPFWFILGHFFGIPFLFIIIIGIIIICIIAGYGAMVKSKYGGEIIVDVQPVPPVPSSRGTSAPHYGVWPGRVRDERYYEDLYYYDEGGPEPVGPTAGIGAPYPYPARAQYPQTEYTYDVIPEDEETGEEQLIPEGLPPEPTPTMEPEEPVEEEEEPVRTEDTEDVLKELHLPEEVELPEDIDIAPEEEEITEEDISEIELEDEEGEVSEGDTEEIDDDVEVADETESEPVEGGEDEVEFELDEDSAESEDDDEELEDVEIGEENEDEDEEVFEVDEE